MTRTLAGALTPPLIVLLTLTGMITTATPAASLPEPTPARAAGMFDGSVRLEVAGTIIVSVVEGLPVDEETVGIDHSGLAYSVHTAGSGMVRVTGPELEGARTGDAFAGIVNVPDAVVERIGGTAEQRVRDASGSALDSETAEAAAIVGAASEAGEALPIVEGTVTSSTVASDEAVRDHVADMVVLDPAGVSPLGGVYTDGEVRTITGAASGFWWGAAIGANGDANLGSFDAASQVIRVGSALGCEQSLGSIWDTAAKQLGFVDALDYLDANVGDGPVRHMVVYLPPGCLDVEPTAVATMGSSVNSGGLALVTLGTEYDLSFTTHELGHHFGLGHSNIDFCTSDATVLGCTEYEYGDFYDIMGATLPGDVTPLNSATELALGWEDPAATVRLGLADDELRQSWTVALTQIGFPGDAAHPSIIEVTDPVSGEAYAVEYRGGSDRVFYDQGDAFSMDAAGEAIVLYDSGVRLLRRTSDDGTSAFTAPSSKGEFNQSSAWYDSPTQDGEIANPSRSVVVEVTGGDPGSYSDVTVTVSRPDDANAVPVFRFWSETYRSHFYTSSVAERDKVIANYPRSIWRYEGPRYLAYDSPQEGTVPVYRFWSPEYRGHFYTIDVAERDKVINNYPDTLWRYEGVAFHVYPLDTDQPNTATVARFWSTLYRHHFYTADPLERDSVLRKHSTRTWKYEFDGFRVPLGSGEGR